MKLYYSVLSVTFGSVPGVLIKACNALGKMNACSGHEKNYHALTLSYKLKERLLVGKEKTKWNKVLWKQLGDMYQKF